MRILFTTDTVGGVWDYSSTLVAAVLARGHEVLVAFVGEPPADRVAELPPNVEWEAVPQPLEWMDGGVEAVPVVSARLRDLARGWRADLVHFNQLAYATRDLDAPSVVVAHSDVYSWFSEVRDEAAPAAWRPYREAVVEGLRAATAVVAPSGYQSGLLWRHYGRAADRVIWNGAAWGAAVPGGAAAVAGGDRGAVAGGRAALAGGVGGAAAVAGGAAGPQARSAPDSAPEPREPAPGATRTGRPRVVALGRAWDPGKGMDVLDRALGLMGDDAPEADLLGSTRGPDGHRFDPVRLRVHGHRGRPEVDRALRDAAVLVAPSRYEPFGLAPLEGALHGCALVLSDIGSFRELWDGCAVFCPPGDAGGLAAALGALLAEPEGLARLGRRARRRALARYGAGAMAASYLRLYAQLTRTSARAGARAIRETALR